MGTAKQFFIEIKWPYIASAMLAVIASILSIGDFLMKSLGVPLWYIWYFVFFAWGCMGLVQAYLSWAKKEKVQDELEKLQESIKNTEKNNSPIIKIENLLPYTQKDTQKDPKEFETRTVVDNGLLALIKEGEKIYDDFIGETDFYKDKQYAFNIRSNRWEKDVSDYLVNHKKDIDFGRNDVFKKREPSILDALKEAEKDRSWRHDLEIFCFRVETLKALFKNWEKNAKQ